MGKRRAPRRAGVTAEVAGVALPMVWRYARGMAGDEAAAREVVHEVFRLVDPADPAAAPPTVDELLACARLACRRGMVGGDADPRRGSSGTDAGAGAAPAGLRDQLADELGAMTADAREALLLLDVLGLAAERAAEICDVEPATLYARRYRAHGRMVARVVGDEL